MRSRGFQSSKFGKFMTCCTVQTGCLGGSVQKYSGEGGRGEISGDQKNVTTLKGGSKKLQPIKRL